MSTAALLSYIQNILTVFSTVIHSIQVFGFFTGPEVTCSPHLKPQSSQCHTVISDSQFIAPSARLTGPVDVPAEVELQKAKGSTEDKPKDPKPEKSRKKGQHKSCKDGSESDNKDKKAESKHKKRQCSPSPVRHHQSTGQIDSTILVSSLFTGAQDSTKHPVAAKPSSSVPGSSGLESHRHYLSPLPVMVLFYRCRSLSSGSRTVQRIFPHFIYRSTGS